MSNPIIVSLPVNVNMDRINHAIKVLQEVVNHGYKFNLNSWFTDHQDINAFANAIESNDMEAIHKCGTAACVLGWVATTPEFKEAGGSVDVHTFSVTIKFNNYRGMEAGIAWFGDNAIAPALFPGSCEFNNDDDDGMAGRLVGAGGSDVANLVNDINNELFVSAYKLHIDDPLDDVAYADITAQEALDVFVHIRDTGCIKLAVLTA